MIKKMIFFILSLCLMFSVTVMAANINDNNEAAEINSENFSGNQGGLHTAPKGEMDGKEMLAPPKNNQNNNIPNENDKEPGNRAPDNMTDNAQNTQEQQTTGFLGFIENYFTPVISVILLILAFIFVIFYKKRQY